MIGRVGLTLAPVALKPALKARAGTAPPGVVREHPKTERAVKNSRRHRAKKIRVSRVGPMAPGSELP